MAERQVTLEDLEAKQEKMREAAFKLNEMNDADDIVKEAKRLQDEAKELEAMAKTWEQQEEARWAAERERLGITERSRVVKVELTDDQRKQILEEEGVRIEVVELEEGIDVHEQTMPVNRPELILELARRKARERKEQEEGAEQARDRAEQALAELEGQSGNPDLQKMLAEKKKDPDFLEGLNLGDE